MWQCTGQAGTQQLFLPSTYRGFAAAGLGCLEWTGSRQAKGRGSQSACHQGMRTASTLLRCAMRCATLRLPHLGGRGLGLGEGLGEGLGLGGGLGEGTGMY